METKQTKVNVLKKIAGIGIIILTLQIPIMKLWDLLFERESTRREAIAQLEKTSGPAQTIIGPVIKIPILVKSILPSTPTEPQKEFAFIFPENLRIDAKLKSDSRQLGIFKIPTYSVELDFSGTFVTPDLKSKDSHVLQYIWNEAVLSIGMSSSKSIRTSQALEWNQSKLEFEPGAEAPRLISRGVHTNLPGFSGSPDQAQIFHTKMTIDGTQALAFIPIGKMTEVNLSGDWADPSFIGSFSTSEREINSDGFKASWKVSDLGGGIGRRQFSELECSSNDQNCNQFRKENYEFGVRLVNAVDTYRIVQRAVKYQLLIVVLTFTTLFLFELIYGLRLHPVQYFLVGLALVLFYLLLLSLAEHVGFSFAYCMASSTVIALVGGYALSVLESKQGALTIIGALVALYVYLLSALTSEEYALISGSIGFTVVLGIVMYCTRRINWYELSVAKKVDVLSAENIA